MSKKRDMDNAGRWLAEISQKIKSASDLLTIAHNIGDWSLVFKVKQILCQLQNRLGNLLTLVQSENWRILGKRDGLDLNGSEEEKEEDKEC